MQSYKTKSMLSRLKMNVSSQFQQTKGRTIITLIIVLLCFIAGIVVFTSSPSCFPGDEYLLDYTGVKTGITAFLARTFSILVVMGLGYGLTIVIFTLPIAVLIIGFRGYLLGFNLSALCAGFGLSGLLDGMLIVLPCQICMLFCFRFMLRLYQKHTQIASDSGRKAAEQKYLQSFLCCFLF